jgi:lysyl endopeptidase
MNQSLKLLLTSSALSLLIACGNNTTSTGADAVTTKSVDVTETANTTATQTLAVDAYRPASNTIAAQDSPIKARDLATAPTPTIVALGSPLASQTAAAQKGTQASAEDHMGKPLQIGFGREAAQTSTPAATQQVLRWKTTASGSQVAAINFTSTGAKGMRLGLLVNQLPHNSTLRFYAKGDTTAFEVKGSVVLDVIAKNVTAGDTSNDAHTYWSPVLKANNGTLEIDIPAGVNISDVQVSIPNITHMFLSMNEAQSILTQSTYDATNPYRTGNVSTQTCQIDVTCTTPLPAATDAVAWLVFNQIGNSASICSGTLLNDNLNSGTPYILTANHCISTQTYASTLYTDFKYRSLACNNAATGEYYPTATTGAKLLYTAAATDSTLLSLYGTPSTAVLFAGWDATVAPALNTVIHGIHHPRGDQQRISRGSISSYFARSGTGGMANSNITSGTILGVAQTSGNTEPGSSGSGLFKGADSNPQVIGQLFGRLVGNNQLDSCADAAETRIYGRFDVAFNAGMKDWLVQGLKPVYRFYNNARGTHFFSQSITEKNYILANYPQFSFENAVFNAYSNVDAATRSPVYRFYNSATQSHFYTIDVNEKNTISANIASGAWPQFAFEGTSWYAKTPAQFAATPDGTIPLYRFYRTNGTHFYTASLAEKNSIQANLSAYYKYEGIAYYVWP